MAHAAPRTARCYVLTVSDTRTEQDDESGRLCRELVVAAGHLVVGWSIVPDDPRRVTTRCEVIIEQREADVILINGGTGISPRDVTFEAVSNIITRPLDGFGELFRMLSFQDIGSKAMASRAMAGAAGRTLLFSMPGSTKAVRLAMERLIVPELGHLVGELNK